jgi:dihydrofolate synthase/folylpolyglutamate synthase
MMALGDALAWLDRHQNLERMLANRAAARPDGRRIRVLMNLLGDPQRTFPSIHLTGTNGKTSTARALTQLLLAQGLSTGTYTSPNLERINERMMANLAPIRDDELTAVLNDLAVLEPMLAPEDRPTWFELVTAAAFSWFADLPVDVGVIEVGLGGRWDATNVVDAAVAVVTNVGLDHVELLGPTRAHIAKEKAGIIKPGSTLVLGEEDPELYEIFAGEQPETLWWTGRDFAVESNRVAVGGRLLDLRTPAARYTEVFLALHGAHQADNFLHALVAAEAFFGRPLDETVVMEAATRLESPGRLEVVHRNPVVVLDGAKNVGGAAAALRAVEEEFGQTRSRLLVVGLLNGHDPEEMLTALGAASSRMVVACAPATPRAVAAETVAEAARAAGAVEVRTVGTVEEAVDVALSEAYEDDLILVGGTLYVVGAARTHLRAPGRQSGQ